MRLPWAGATPDPTSAVVATTAAMLADAGIILSYPTHTPEAHTVTPTDAQQNRTQAREHTVAGLRREADRYEAMAATCAFASQAAQLRHRARSTRELADSLDVSDR